MLIRKEYTSVQSQLVAGPWTLDPPLHHVGESVGTVTVVDTTSGSSACVARPSGDVSDHALHTQRGETEKAQAQAQAH